MAIEQLPLFPGDQPQQVTGMAGDAGTPLSTAIERFGVHLEQEQYAENTVKSFLGDLRIFQRYLKADRPIGQIATQDLRDFLHWLQHERGKPCSPKSYARRMTTLKVFFAWLVGQGALSADPAAALIHKPAKTPLPRILYGTQIEKVLAATQEMMVGAPPRTKPDPRPHLLVTLVLHTGIKKQECMGIKLSHIDTTDPGNSVLHIRYDQPRMHYKERRLGLPVGWARTLDLYLQAYEAQQHLFPCTPRNLEYVLANVAKLAGLSDGLSFEMLRWTCAVRDHKAGMDPERLRRKLGLSQMSWRETEPKLVQLTEPAL